MSRALFCQGTDGVTSIKLESTEKSVWFAEFAGHDLSCHKNSELRNSVSVRELSLLLGAPDDNDDASYSLVPGLLSSRFAAVSSTVIDL